MHFPALQSQTFNVQSMLPVISLASSNCNARTANVWPLRQCSWVPVSMFQTRTVRSYDPLMRTGKEGCGRFSLNWRHITPSVCPVKVRVVHRPRRQLRSTVIRSPKTTFQGFLTEGGMGIVVEETEDSEKTASSSSEVRATVPDLGGECERTGDGLESGLVELELVSSDRYLFSGGVKAMEHGSALRFEHVGKVAVIFNADDGVGARCLDEGPGEPGAYKEGAAAGSDDGPGELDFGLYAHRFFSRMGKPQPHFAHFWPICCSHIPFQSTLSSARAFHFFVTCAALHREVASR